MIIYQITQSMNKPHFGTFRGWSEKHNRWVDGWRVRQSIVSSWNDSVYQVYPESLAMFTGQYDKEDKPLYASIPLPDGTMSKGGDILKCKYIKYHVYYCVNTAMFRGTCGNRYPELMHLLDVENETTIIGNAYENPELMEVKE